MPYRNQNSGRMHDRVPGYYARNKLYPSSYARNEYQTRTSRRVHDGLVLSQNYGLDTTSDDINSSPYSSPFYINGRYNSDQLTTQRGNSASVQGTSRLLSIHDELTDFTDADIQTYLTLWQGKQIKFKMNYTGKIVGNTITLKNTDGCTGILSIYLSATENGVPIYETAIDLCDISMDKFEHKQLFSNIVFPKNANPRGEVYVRMEIWNEISSERSDNPFNTGRKIEIAATGKGNHKECIYKLSDKNTPNNESEKYEYSPQPSMPLMAFVYNNYTSVPVNRTEPYANGAIVASNGYKYGIYCCKNDSAAEVIIYDKQMNSIVSSNIKVDARADEINLIQAKDYVYYVDGYSPLQKFHIGEWTSSALPMGGSEDPVIAPSIICLHHNRIYIGGFRYDPNLVQFTKFSASGPEFEKFTYKFYVPDQSPLATSDNPVTAIVEYESDTLMIAGKNFYSLWTSNVAVEDAYPQQVSNFTDGGGVQTPGDICNFHGTLYSFDQDEGIRRFNGATWERIPQSVDSHVERVDMSKPRRLWGYANKLYFNYTDAIDGKYKCLIWDKNMNYQQFPWFQDYDLPFCDVRYDDDYDITGIHPDYPCIMRLYDKTTWRRLDSPIVFERHTKYISIPGNADDLILKRVHNKVLANANSWWWFSISYDRHNLTPTRGKDNWYRLPCWATEEYEEQAETPFPSQDVYESDAIAMLTISNLRGQAMSVQEKIKCKTFRSQANLVSTEFEAQPRQML